MSSLGGIARRVLLGPDFVARAAAGRAGGREEMWMLSQPRAVRQSYVREVVDRGEDPVHVQIWMLRQAKPVRESYVKTVLEPQTYKA
jgi:hypothetical protein